MKSADQIIASLLWWFEDARGSGYTVRTNYFSRLAFGGFITGAVLGMILTTQGALFVFGGLYLLGTVIHYLNYRTSRSLGLEIETLLWNAIPGLALLAALFWRLA